MGWRTCAISLLLLLIFSALPTAKGQEGNLPTLPEAIKLLQLEKKKVVQSKITIVNMTNVILQNYKVSKETQGLLEAPAKTIKKANLEIDNM